MHLHFKYKRFIFSHFGKMHYQNLCNFLAMSLILKLTIFLLYNACRLCCWPTAIGNIILAAVKLKGGNFTSTSQQRHPLGDVAFWFAKNYLRNVWQWAETLLRSKLCWEGGFITNPVSKQSDYSMIMLQMFTFMVPSFFIKP